MRVLFIITISAVVVIALALALGVLRPGLTAATLERHAARSLADCMHDAGIADARERSGPLTEEQAQAPYDRARERCRSRSANDPRFERLALTDPIAEHRKLRARGFKVWRCAERAGYTRTTQIPLSGPGGYPLQLAAGNFRTGRSGHDLERFYRVAARCSGESIAAFRWSDGTFSRATADGVADCTRHEHHGSGRHSHGCYGVVTYPDIHERSGG